MAPWYPVVGPTFCIWKNTKEKCFLMQNVLCMIDPASQATLEYYGGGYNLPGWPNLYSFFLFLLFIDLVFHVGPYWILVEPKNNNIR